MHPVWCQKSNTYFHPDPTPFLIRIRSGSDWRKICQLYHKILFLTHRSAKDFKVSFFLIINKIYLLDIGQEPDSEFEDILYAQAM